MDGASDRIVEPARRWRRLYDDDQILAAFGELVQDCVQLGRGSGENVLFSANFGLLQVRAMSLSGGRRFQGQVAQGQATFQLDLGSSAGRRVRGQELALNDVVIGGGAATFDFVSAARHRGVNLTLPERVFVDALDARSPGAEVLAHGKRMQVATLSDARTARLRDLVGAALDDRSGATTSRSWLLAEASIADARIDVALDPWLRESEADVRAPHYQRLPVVRSAEEFMRANLGEPIMLHDTCRAARASERTVGYAFHDVYGMGPKQYLRTLRLNRVRRDLVESTDMTIAEIALRAGLWHLGHFSVDYRRLFGETAQQTRMRRGFAAHAGVVRERGPASRFDARFASAR